MAPKKVKPNFKPQKNKTSGDSTPKTARPSKKQTKKTHGDGLKSDRRP